LGEVTRMRREAGFLGVIKGLMGLGVGGRVWGYDFESFCFVGGRFGCDWVWA
jgi:hypothetical protein